MADPCPLEDRRSMMELWSKLAFVHVTVMVAFCHLLSVRGERILSWKMAFYFICPVIVCIQYSLALLILSIAGLFARLSASSKVQNSLERAPGILFGKLDYGKRRTPLPVHEDADSVSGRPMTMKVGRVFAALFIATQCICSIVIFARRQQHGATTQSDRRVLELACGGVVAALLNVAYLLWEPRANADELLWKDDSTNLELALIWLRDVPVERPGSDDDWSQLRSFALSSLMAFVVSCVQDKISLRTGFRQFFSSEFWDQATEKGFLNVGAPYGFEVKILCFAMLASLIVGSCASSGRMNSKNLCSVLLCVPLATISMALLWIPVLLLLSPVWNAIIACRQWEAVSGELQQLAKWPTDEACPLLWQDPMASAFWGLA